MFISQGYKFDFKHLERFGWGRFPSRNAGQSAEVPVATHKVSRENPVKLYNNCIRFAVTNVCFSGSPKGLQILLEPGLRKSFRGKSRHQGFCEE